MSNLTVVDGDFVAQLHRYLNQATLRDPAYDMQTLVNNRYAVYKTHLDFLRAGAKIIKTNTARATASFLAKHLRIYGTEAMSVITTAVELAQKAVFKYYEETGGDTSNTEEFKNNRPQVAGCCASYAVARLDKNGPVDYWRYVNKHDLIRCHRMRMQALLNAGVDLLALEAIPSMIEVVVLVDLLRQFRNARVWISFMCRNDMELLDGSSFLEIAVYCYHSLPGRVLAIGAVCPTLQHEITLLEDVCSNTSEDRLPMMMYFNETNEEKCDVALYLVSKCINLEVLYISGKSGSTAEDIQIIHNAVGQFYGSSCTVFKTCSRSEENKSRL